MNMWKRTYNVHKTFIYNIRMPKHENTYDFFVQVRNFLLPLSLKVFRHKERDTIFLCWLFHLPTPARAVPVAHKFFWPRPVAWRHSHPWSHPLSGIFYCGTSEWHVCPACVWTPALMLHLTNSCSKRKVLSLTKPKGKIYKTKSLGHYITISASK